jgi:hypothetical protein
MRLHSTDRTAWLEITRKAGGEHSPFSVECSVNIVHGRFDAKNSDIHFLNFDEFVNKLDAFILNRAIPAQLHGTYDTIIKFFQPEGKTIVMVSFAIGDAYAGYSSTVHYKTEGEFEINAEYLNDIVKNFRDLFQNA